MTESGTLLHFVLPTRAAVLARIRATSLFEGEEEEELRPLVLSARAQALKKGDVVWCTGEEIDALALVLDGALVVARRGRALREITSGEFVGLSAVLADVATTADVWARETSLILHIPRVIVDAYATEHPVILRRAVRHLAELVEVLTKERQRAEDTARPSELRVFEWLREHAIDDTVAEADAQQIARDLDIHWRSVHDAKKLLRSRGWIQYEDRTSVVEIIKRSERAASERRSSFPRLALREQE